MLSIIAVALISESKQVASFSILPNIAEPALNEIEARDVTRVPPDVTSANPPRTDNAYAAEVPRKVQILLQKNFILVMPLFFVLTIRYILLGILIQYSSARFGWDITESGIFQSEVAIVGFVQYVFLLPALMSYL